MAWLPAIVPNIAAAGPSAAAFSSLSAAPWKRPYLKRPPNASGRIGMPPSAHGPMTMPAASSPRIDGSFRSDASAPPTFAAKMMTPICSTRNIMSSVRGRPKFG